MQIRTATVNDIAQMQHVELDAAQLFESLPNYGFCAKLPCRNYAEHLKVQNDGAAMVIESNNKIVGFILMVPIDNRAHILELAVAMTAQRQGLGKELLNAAEVWARAKHFSDLTLTTFCDPAWNAPWYAKHGFTKIQLDESRPELLRIWNDEIEHGIHQQPRTAMQKSCRILHSNQSF